ncbi:hypothetical protein [Mailhella massiliensis]|uniref:Type III secretion system chaperone n=1 Tax=Mailhella massiliensis TaxID=1903261 RepID=A0A921AU82_9BACT|nr:hypothetical protein [Mailhella massiliensis]HJD96233.1 hypothetical protein [Mailhella massiliensis]
MASPLQQTADIITRAAGWEHATPDEEGCFHFSLEGGLDFSLFSPENRTGILLSSLGKAPESDEEVRRLAALAAGCLKKRRSVFSIGEHGLELHRAFPLSSASESFLIPEVRDFLNDLAWWKRQISGGGASMNKSSSPFSLPFGNWFPG